MDGKNSYIFTDAKTLLEFPHLLRSMGSHFRLLLTDIEWDQFQFYINNIEYRILRDVIFDGSPLNHLKIIPTSYQNKRTKISNSKLSSDEQRLLNSVLSYQSQFTNKKVILFTTNHLLREVAKSIGLECISDISQLNIPEKSRLLEVVADIQPLIKKAKLQNRFLRVFSIISLTIGFGLTIPTLGNLVKVFDFLTNTISIWGILILVIIAGISLFFFRSRAREYYGLFETLFGILASYFTLNQMLQPIQESQLTNFIAFLASLYVIVRGLDNIGAGIRKKSGWKLKRLWEKFFPE